MKLSERINVLEQAGINTDKYQLQISGAELSIVPSTDMIVEDKQIDNPKLFRRWITAQTFRMLNTPTYNYKTHAMEVGWDAYLRNRYDYKYQFSMMLEEMKTLNKLEKTDKEQFKERTAFFNQKVVVDTCNHYIRQFKKYVKEHMKEDDTVKLAINYKADAKFVAEYIDDMKEIIHDIRLANSYAEVYAYLKKFIRKMNKLPNDTPKCPQWKDAFKGSGAYYSLKNICLFHGVVLRDCKDKNESMAKLDRLFIEYKGEGWRFHQLLKDTIELNSFDLKESINRNK